MKLYYSESVRMDIYFYLTEKSRRPYILEAYQTMVKDLFQDNYCSQWEVAYRSVFVSKDKDYIKLLDRLLEPGNFDGYFTAISRKNGASNRATMREVYWERRSLREEIWPKDVYQESDQKKIYDEILEKDISDREKLELLSELFYMDDCRDYDLKQQSDAGGVYRVVPYSDKRYENYIHGCFSVDVCCHDPDTDINRIAEYFKEKCTRFCEDIPNANAIITLLPASRRDGLGCLAHYFYQYSDFSEFCIPEGMDYAEWWDFFFRDCGWWNHLSPCAAEIVRKVLPQELLSNDSRVESVGDSMNISSQYNIEQTDISELLRIKELLYPVVYPGDSFFRKSLFLDKNDYPPIIRWQWERVPIFHDEMEITDEGILFTSRNSKPDIQAKIKEIIDAYVAQILSKSE